MPHGEAPSFEEHVRNVFGVSPEPMGDEEPVEVEETEETEEAEEAEEDLKLVSGEESEEDVEEDVEEEEAPTLETLQSRLAETQAKLEEAERAASGRLGEITSLRTSNRELKEDISTLRKEVRELVDGISKSAVPQLPPEVEDDETVGYFKHRLDAIDREREEERKAREEQAAVARETQDTIDFASRSAEAYKAIKPDWNEAHAFVRQKFAEANPQIAALPPAQQEARVNMHEHVMVRQWRSMGMDPAHMIYEVAVANGYGQNNGGESVGGRSIVDEKKVENVRKALKSSNVSQVRSEPENTGRGGTISQAQFMRQYSNDEIIGIFQGPNGDTIQEELSTLGSVRKSLLPAGQ